MLRPPNLTPFLRSWPRVYEELRPCWSRRLHHWLGLRRRREVLRPNVPQRMTLQYLTCLLLTFLAPGRWQLFRELRYGWGGRQP